MLSSFVYPALLIARPESVSPVASFAAHRKQWLFPDTTSSNALPGYWSETDVKTVRVGQIAISSTSLLLVGRRPRGGPQIWTWETCSLMPISMGYEMTFVKLPVAKLVAVQP